MSEFFEPPSPPPEPPPHERRQPEWFGPPDNYLGALIALDLVPARTSELAVVVPAATVYPRGATFNVVVLMRRELRDPFDWHPFHPRRRREGGLEPELLRIGVQFSDGAKATSLGTPLFRHDPNEPPQGPLLMPRGGGGGGRRWDVSFWLWPLPPPGPFAFVCEWPARGIGLTRVEIDSQPLLDAANRTKPLWPDDEEGPSPGGGWVQQTRIG